jgi:uncharacterized protein YsxB (DUF464 family)
MIKVTLTNDKSGSFVSLIAKGHANTAPYGADLVCSAISSIILGGFNALEDEANFEAKVDTGYASLSSKKKASEHDEIVLSTIVTQIESLATSHPEAVKLERK